MAESDRMECAYGSRVEQRGRLAGRGACPSIDRSRRGCLGDR